VGVGLPSFLIEAGELLQHVSRVVYRDTPLHFGRDGTNRYDAPTRDYGVLYLGLDLPTALMESVFHKHQWDRETERSITLPKSKLDSFGSLECSRTWPSRISPPTASWPGTSA
jgi:hypothetical protein